MWSRTFCIHAGVFSHNVAVNSLGETEEGLRDAVGEQQLISALQAEGYIPVRVVPAGTIILNKKTANISRTLGTIVGQWRFDSVGFDDRS